MSGTDNATEPVLPPEEELFAAALEQPADVRAAWLARACGSDVRLRREVEALLKAHDAADRFIDQSPTVGLRLTEASSPLAEEQPGARIDRYKLLQKIGEGGCGTVHLAEQEEPVRRRVALKIIKLGMDTRAVVARFEAERQALALMDHPNIARVFDGGATDQGRPYFVMELVRGVRITDYCNQNSIPTRQRLELFLQVCQAIQHAHQKGIVHRDIKPSNILVSFHDGQPVPKVIDFGIAKAMQGRLTDRTLITAQEQFIGTPAYMSPEQADLTRLDIDTRSDIYSLGVLLYEMLTGGQPFDPGLLNSAGLDEMRRIIREEEPPPPSHRLRDLPPPELARLAARHEASPAQLHSRLRGDLDWIVMKALEKSPARRYEAVSNLASDIRRHLHHEPVSARPPSVGYRLGKLIRRNRLAAAIGAVIALTLITGLVWPNPVSALSVAPAALAAALLVGLSVSRLRMVRARRAEHEQAQMARFMRSFVRNLVHLAAVEGDRALLARYLELTTQGLDDELPNQPEMKAEVLETLGGISLSIGQLESAETKFTRAFGLRQEAQGRNHPEVGRCLNYLGLVQSAAGRYAEAERSLRSAQALQVRLPQRGGPDLPRTLGNLGWVFTQQGNLPAAELVLEEALSILRPEGDGAELAFTLKRLGFVHAQQGRLPEAERELAEARDMNIRVLGQDHLEVASSLNFLGVALAVQDQSPWKVIEAIGLYNQALAIRERLKAHGGSASPDRLNTLLSQQGTLAEIESLLELLRRQARAQRPDDAWQHAYFEALTAVVLLEERKFSEAETAARSCHALRHGVDPDDWSTFHALAMRGSALAGMRDFAAAGELLHRGYEGMRARENSIPGPHRLWLGKGLQDLAAYCRATGRMDQAAHWTSELQRWGDANPDLARILQRSASPQ